MVVENRKAILAAITKAMRAHGLKRAKPFNTLLLTPSLTPEESTAMSWRAVCRKAREILRREWARHRFRYYGDDVGLCEWPRWQEHMGPFPSPSQKQDIMAKRLERQRAEGKAGFAKWLKRQPAHVKRIHQMVLERLPPRRE